MQWVSLIVLLYYNKQFSIYRLYPDSYFVHWRPYNGNMIFKLNFDFGQFFHFIFSFKVPDFWQSDTSADHNLSLRDVNFLYKFNKFGFFRVEFKLSPFFFCMNSIRLFLLFNRIKTFSIRLLYNFDLRFFCEQKTLSPTLIFLHYNVNNTARRYVLLLARPTTLIQKQNTPYARKLGVDDNCL